MHIREYSEYFEEDVKDLLFELRRHLVRLDPRSFIMLKNNYRDEYFSYVSEEVEKHNGKIYVAEKDGKAIGVIVCKIFQDGNEIYHVVSDRVHIRSGSYGVRARQACGEGTCLSS